MNDATHIWMFFYRYINFFRMNDWRSAALGKNERLLHVAVDLEQVAPHLPDFWKKENISVKIETLMIDFGLEAAYLGSICQC